MNLLYLQEEREEREEREEEEEVEGPFWWRYMKLASLC
jgi:hypothetical protein